jgi:adenylate cyclase
MSADDMERLWRALGFAEPAQDAQGYTDADIAAAAEVAQLAGDGVIDLDLVIGMVRPMGHLVSRLGAAQVSALSGVSGVVGRPGQNGHKAPAGRPPDGADQLVPLLERLVVHAWRRHLATAASAAMPLGGLDKATSPKSVGFIDITSYTTLSRRIDWAELAALLERFEECVFDRVSACGGRVVKTLGDEVLFIAPHPGAGAEIALAVMDAGRTDPYLPSVHAGLAYGPLLERAGDVFGPTVNVASRVTDLARAGAVLVDGAFKHEIEADRRYRIQRRPRRPVRGYASLATYRLMRADPRRTV